MPDSSGPLRPPSEAHSLLVRVTRGCPWNRCAFCAAYKDLKFGIRGLAEVEHDIAAARQALDSLKAWAAETGHSLRETALANGIMWLEENGVESVFFQDSDSLVMKTESLTGITALLYQTFPQLKRVSSYTRGKTLYRKSLSELRTLRESGISRLHVGLESEDDSLLAYMQKGSTAAQITEGCRKALAAGFEVSVYVMPGLGGRDRWRSHAADTAAALNAIDPHFIRLRTLQLIPGTTLYKKAASGEFHIQTVQGLLEEVRTMVKDLNVHSRLVSSDFAMNYYMGDGADGKLPEEKNKILAQLERAAGHWRLRGEPARSPFSGGLEGV